MGRPQLIALAIIVVFVGGLAAVRYTPDGDTTSSASESGGPESSKEPSSTEPEAASSEVTDSEIAEPESVESTEPTKTDDQTDVPAVLRPAPPLTNVEGWLNTENDSLSDFDGEVKIVQFWTFSCHNCTATIPFLQDIYKNHQPDGLEIIGVHTPEFDFEKDPAGVAKAAADLGVTWPVALDPKKTNFRAWQGDRRFWPRTYVIDQVGNIRYDHIGEGRYDELEQTVAWLLENGP